jgi:hypothetical protein
MKKQQSVQELAAEIDKFIQILHQNTDFYSEFCGSDLRKLGKGTAAAMVLSQIFTDYYTSLETLFLRISQFFENSLSKKEWHKDLLLKMTLNVTGLRMPVISDSSYACCMELLRFRHFRRYYFELEYDWDRIANVEKKYKQLRKTINADLAGFKQFLLQVADSRK